MVRNHPHPGLRLKRFLIWLGQQPLPLVLLAGVVLGLVAWTFGGKRKRRYTRWSNARDKERRAEARAKGPTKKA
jgi:hypothetical protein